MNKRMISILAITCLAAIGLILNAQFAQCGQAAQKQGAKKEHAANSETHSTNAPLMRTALISHETPEQRAHWTAIMSKGNDMEKQARALMDQGNLPAAEQQIKQAISYYEGLPELHGDGYMYTPRARQTLGDIYLKGGQYQKALAAYGIVGKQTRGAGAPMGPSLNLGVALAYCGLGDYEDARQYYSDKAITQYSFGGKKVGPSDLPGTDSPQTLKASILLARGIDFYFHEMNAHAAEDFAAAGKLTPDNPLLNYYWGDALDRLNRPQEAIPHAQIAAERGHGALAEIAKHKLIGVQSDAIFIAKQHPTYFVQHPDQAPKYRDQDE